MVFATAVEGAYQGRDSGCETNLHHHSDHEQTVDKCGRCKLVGTVGSHHHRVGEAHDDNTQLGHKHRQPKSHKIFIFSFIGFPEACFAHKSHNVWIFYG